MYKNRHGLVYGEYICSSAIHPQMTSHTDPSTERAGQRRQAHRACQAMGKHLTPRITWWGVDLVEAGKQG
eukprot:scaffold325476_cov20-Prasinocladus_malaysianus.AAC.1